MEHGRELTGRILVAERTDPGWTVLFPAVAGLLIQRGSLLSHSAIVAREMGIPCVVGVANLLATVRDGEEVEHTGEYLEIVRPRRLVFTFSVPKFSAEITRVTIDIVPSGEGCKLTLTHENVLPGYASRAESGWTDILGGLAATLG